MEELDPGSETVAAEVAAYRGSWWEQMSVRVPQAIEMETSTFLAWAAWRVGRLMLLGMALFKLGVFSAERSRRFYLTCIALAVGVGLPLVWLGIRRNFAGGWEAPGFFFLGLQLNYWASRLVALGWVGAVMLVCRHGGRGWLTRPLAAVGQMAFTNYILQTVICTTLFYGHGFGLFGRVERTGQAAVVVAVWAFQIVLSPLWLTRFRFGPLEWLWRTLAYMERQPFRRA